ncbi:hypothetical protein E2C01_080642 [Portunus trituberculatus]|uniref:Uncharacterized protein n=1 Tax=Portunus trituberculatus TaxID=210409 RepID=A0A5B7J052_PORTR|nr:hypothetical protein [Portunus trituberculatus]
MSSLPSLHFSPSQHTNPSEVFLHPFNFL